MIYFLVLIVGILVGYVISYIIDQPKQEKSNKEQVNHPAHYKNSKGKECIDLMREKYGDYYVYAFCICNAFKYRFRAGKKYGNSKQQDLNKAKWYENYANNLSQINVKF